MKLSKPALSNVAETAVKVHGHRVLGERKLHPDLARGRNGVKYVGNLFFSVLVKENGYIYAVDISSKE